MKIYFEAVVMLPVPVQKLDQVCRLAEARGFRALVDRLSCDVHLFTAGPEVAHTAPGQLKWLADEYSKLFKGNVEYWYSTAMIGDFSDPVKEKIDYRPASRPVQMKLAENTPLLPKLSDVTYEVSFFSEVRGRETPQGWYSIRVDVPGGGLKSYRTPKDHPWDWSRIDSDTEAQYMMALNAAADIRNRIWAAGKSPSQFRIRFRSVQASVIKAIRGERVPTIPHIVEWHDQLMNVLKDFGAVESFTNGERLSDLGNAA